MTTITLTLTHRGLINNSDSNNNNNNKYINKLIDLFVIKPTILNYQH